MKQGEYRSRNYGTCHDNVNLGFAGFAHKHGVVSRKLKLPVHELMLIFHGANDTP